MEKIKNNYKSIILVLGFVAMLFSIIGLIEVIVAKDLYANRFVKDELNLVIFGSIFSLGSAIALFVLSLLNKTKKLYVAIAGLFVFASLIFLISYSVAIDKFTFTSFLEFL